MDLGLDGKVALVAAASKGLGKAAAMALAREGARVALCARTEADLLATAAEISERTGAEVLARRADLTSAADIDDLVAATADRFGGVDILVSNSGGPPVGRFSALTDADWQQGFEAVTLSFVRLVRGVLPFMQARGWGRIVGIQSSSVKQPVRNIDLSNGLRPGIAGLAKSLMPELAAAGITINLVLPGSFQTARLGVPEGPPADEAARQRLAELGARAPAGRLGDPMELGDLVAFLASARAGYITGTVMQIDGGIIGSNV